MSNSTEFKAANLGFPRIGAMRELKMATESYWKGQIQQAELLSVAKKIRKANWLYQKESGIEIIPSNDFSFYDQMLDMSCLLGAIPARYKFSGDIVGLDTYFSMARGIQEKEGVSSKSVHAMEMTKWMDTNYHYIVPEFTKGQTFKLSSTKIFDEFKEALDLGITTRPVVIGPLSFLYLGKSKEDGFDPTTLLNGILPVYEKTLKKLKDLGARSIQIDEPALVLDLPNGVQNMFAKAYDVLAKSAPGLQIHLATYFETIEDKLKLVASLPVAGVHVDLVRAPRQLNAVLSQIPADKVLSLGIVDGRNIWKNDLNASIRMIREALNKSPRKKIEIAGSCSLIHSPIDLEVEAKLDNELKSWLAFAKQKIHEISTITKALSKGDEAVRERLIANASAIKSRQTSKRIHVDAVKNRLSKVTAKDYERGASILERKQIQKKQLNLPLYPTTTIGSFPQTKEVRAARLKFKKGEFSADKYNAFIQDQIKDCIKRQDDLGLDVYVHGEFERNDMVEYFGEQLEGFAFTQLGWVQSYGSRYVKPPIIFGDVHRPKAMTVDWYVYAQKQTKKPVKGMLTGPVTILQWSFVRNDQPRKTTAMQIGLAIRDEVRDLEKAGAKIIQIDEAAFREGLPLRKANWKDYLQWAVEAFRLCSSGVKNETQIHTHMCYSEFNDIIQAIADMNADVISIETSRSQMELLDAFVKFQYPSGIGPGVYDIHSPRVPSRAEIDGLLDKAAQVLPHDNIWVNPDCGLKTRGWDETTLALKFMVESARAMRKRSNHHAEEPSTA